MIFLTCIGMEAGRITRLADPRLSDVLQHFVLPQLSVFDLGRLICTCRDLSGLIAKLDVAPWRELACGPIGFDHPALVQGSVRNIQQALWQHNRVTQNVHAGAYSFGDKVKGASTMRFSPDGSKMASLVFQTNEVGCFACLCFACLEVHDVASSLRPVGRPVCISLGAVLGPFSVDFRWVVDGAHVMVMQH